MASRIVRNASSLPDSGSQVFNVKAYGAKGDGTTDDTTAINSAITAANTAGGGTIYFPTATYLVLGAINIPFTGPAGLPVQKPFRFTGETPSWNGYWQQPPVGGSILDLRFNGDAGTHVAKIDTRGAGFLEIDHLTLKSGGTDNFLFMQTTNTTVSVHDNCVIGNQANSLTTCQQDFLVCGGTGTTFGNGSNAPFQGYGSKIQNNFYSNIRAGVTFGNDCNGIEVQNETYSKTCGSNLAQGAPYYFQPVTLHGCGGNRIIGGTVEVTGYPYVVTFIGECSQNTVMSVGAYDDNATTLGFAYFSDGSKSVYNLIIAGFFNPGKQGVYLAGPGASLNTLIGGGQYAVSNFSQGFISTANPIVAANIKGNTLLTSVSASLPNGTSMKIDSGAGGSYIDYNAYAHRFNDNAGVEKARITASGYLGVGTPSPTSTIHAAGSIATAFAAKTGAYTLTATDSIISVDSTAAIFTVTLPDATTCVGRQYTIKKIDASVNAVTLACFSTQTIDGATTKAVSGQWTVVKVVSNGANWLVV